MWKRASRLYQCRSDNFPPRQRHAMPLLMRSFSGSTTRDGLYSYLQSNLDIDPSHHYKIISALESVYGKDIRLEHLQAIGKEGIQSLAASVENSEKKRQGRKKRPSAPLHVSISHHGKAFEVEWKVGDSILQTAKNNEDLLGEYLEGICGGNMNCCTCHIYIDQSEFKELLSEPEEEELDMLALAYDSKESSRLGCRVFLTNQMLKRPTKLEVRIPEGVNNVWNL